MFFKVLKVKLNLSSLGLISHIAHIRERVCAQANKKHVPIALRSFLDFNNNTTIDSNHFWMGFAIEVARNCIKRCRSHLI